MFAAVAAGVETGGYATVVEASRHTARLRQESYRPNLDHRAVYDELGLLCPSGSSVGVPDHDIQAA